MMMDIFDEDPGLRLAVRLSVNFSTVMNNEQFLKDMKDIGIADEDATRRLDSVLALHKNLHDAYGIDVPIEKLFRDEADAARREMLGICSDHAPDALLDYYRNTARKVLRI